jgi:hypothetical protein
MCHRGRRNPKLTRPPLKPSSSTGRFFPEHMPRLRPPAADSLAGGLFTQVRGMGILGS